MKTIARKTQLMLDLESRYYIPIEEVLRIKFVDEGESIAQIGREMCISYRTVLKWLALSGIHSRKLKMEE